MSKGEGPREKVQGDAQGRRFKEMSKGEGSRRCPREKVQGDVQGRRFKEMSKG